MTLLEISDLHTQFDTPEGAVHAVDNVNLEIGDGEIVGLVGESGSGKSALAKSVMRLINKPGEISSGSINIMGEDILLKKEKEMNEVRGGTVSMVFQDPMNSLNPVISIGEQIAESIRLHQIDSESTRMPAEIKRKILGTSQNSTSWIKAIEMLETVEIPEPENRVLDYPHQFSGGMLQRAMIAMALAGDPDLLIADEPTTALDVTIQAQLLEELSELRDEFGMSILLITHDIPVISEICDRVNVMYAGKIVEHAPTNELFNNPQHPYTQGLLKSVPQIGGEMDRLEPISGTTPQLIEPQPACHFAPRCPEATDECYEIEPDFRDVGPDHIEHRVACLRRGDDEEKI